MDVDKPVAMTAARGGLIVWLLRLPTCFAAVAKAASSKAGRRRARAGLASERNEALVAALKAERASLAAQNRRIETETGPIRYVAEAARRSGAAQGLSIALRPASVILTVLRSAVASPARTRPASVLRLKPWANMIVSLAPNGMLASS